MLRKLTDKEIDNLKPKCLIVPKFDFMENPIIDNRIVNDKTFARRLKSHLTGVQASCGMGQEEIDYLTRVANKLLGYQLETCTDDEKAYHNNCDPDLKL